MATKTQTDRITPKMVGIRVRGKTQRKNPLVSGVQSFDDESAPRVILPFYVQTRHGREKFVTIAAFKSKDDATFFARTHYNASHSSETVRVVSDE